MKLICFCFLVQLFLFAKPQSANPPGIYKRERIGLKKIPFPLDNSRVDMTMYLTNVLSCFNTSLADELDSKTEKKRLIKYMFAANCYPLPFKNLVMDDSYLLVYYNTFASREENFHISRLSVFAAICDTVPEDLSDKYNVDTLLNQAERYFTNDSVIKSHFAKTTNAGVFDYSKFDIGISPYGKKEFEVRARWTQSKMFQFPTGYKGITGMTEKDYNEYKASNADAAKVYEQTIADLNENFSTIYKKYNLQIDILDNDTRLERTGFSYLLIYLVAK